MNKYYTSYHIIWWISGDSQWMEIQLLVCYKWNPLIKICQNYFPQPISALAKNDNNAMLIARSIGSSDSTLLQFYSYSPLTHSDLHIYIIWICYMMMVINQKHIHLKNVVYELIKSIRTFHHEYKMKMICFHINVGKENSTTHNKATQ